MSRECIFLSQGVQLILKSEDGIKKAEEEPLRTAGKDKCHLALILFYLMGTLAALPENFLLTATDYWNYKFRNVTEPGANNTQLQTEFFSVFNSAAASASVIALLLSLKLVNVFSIQTRLLAGMFVIMNAFGITTIFLKIDTDTWQYTFYIISIVTGSLIRAFGTLFNVSCLQLAWNFSPKYLTAQATGRSICGTLVALIQIIALAAASNRETIGFIYFFIGTQCVVVTMTLYVIISRLSAFYKEHSSKVAPNIEGSQYSKEIFKSVFSKLWMILLALTFIMIGSSVVHPGVTSLIRSVNPGTAFADKFFVPVTTFLLFNIGDLIGREIARKCTLNIKPVLLVIIGLARLMVFVPLILLCNIQPRQNLQVVFDNDYTYIILMILFGLTEGCFGHICILMLPTLINPKETKMGVALIVLFMTVTVALFSYVSIIIVKFI